MGCSRNGFDRTGGTGADFDGARFAAASSRRPVPYGGQAKRSQGPGESPVMDVTYAPSISSQSRTSPVRRRASARESSIVQTVVSPMDVRQVFRYRRVL